MYIQHIHSISKLHTQYICHINFTYKLHMLHLPHMDYIQITYELHTGYIWKLISTTHTCADCDLHTDYIWKHNCTYPAYIQYISLKKSTKASWISEAIFERADTSLPFAGLDGGWPVKVGASHQGRWEMLQMQQPIRKRLEIIPNIAWPAII